MLPSSLSQFKSTASRWTWGSTVSIARIAVNNILSNLDTGSLLLVDTDGTQYSFGEASIIRDNAAHARHDRASPTAKIVVKNETFWLRLFLFADMGFAESYMLADFDCDNLTAFFQIFILNKDTLDDSRSVFWLVRNSISRLGRTANTLSNSLLNTAAHYDISNDMFAAFLSKDMTYSCPIWRRERGGSVNDQESLVQAQQTKLRRFIDGAAIKATDEVLEIGTGWGSFAIEAVQRTGCRVTTITLSIKQKQLAEERIHAAGLTDRIDVIFMDYRQIPTLQRTFDKVVSIEMIEAVGAANLHTYFAIVNQVLRSKGGIAMFQCITMPEAQHQADSNKREFIGQYIFPGGYLPSTMELLNHINVQSRGTLSVENVENIGPHYSKALRLWREEFLLHFEQKIMPALMGDDRTMSEAEVQVFRRKWEYYFSYCEAGFVTKWLNDVIITVARPGAMELMEGVPL